MSLVIATWNVNSLRVRLPLLFDFLLRYKPDIVALQETKVANNQFPLEEIKAVGYHALFQGQKTYNGVALLSKSPLQLIHNTLPQQEDLQCRLLSACLGRLKIINIYAPNGGTIDSNKYQYKLKWFEQLHNYLQDALLNYPSLLVLGDYNIAPQDEDVHDPKQWEGKVLVSPPERMAFKKLLDIGLYDTFRLDHSGGDYYTWWDYRQAAFRRNQGLRIDHILCSQALSSYFERSEIDLATRRLTRPSDHTPLLTYFNSKCIQ